MLIIELFLHYGAVKNLGPSAQKPCCWLMYELQYSTHVHRRPVCILLRQSLWRGWRGVRREGRKGGWWKWGTRKASQQCFITSNNIRNEVLVFICFNFLQMWKAECKHHHAYNALRCDVRQTRRFFFCTGKCVLKSHWTSAGWHKDEVWPFCQMLWNFERIVSEAALLCFLSAVDR